MLPPWLEAGIPSGARGDETAAYLKGLGSALADYAATRAQDPDLCKQDVLFVVNKYKDEFADAYAKAEAEGTLHEFYADIAGRVAFEMATILPPNKLAKVEKVAGAIDGLDAHRTMPLAALSGGGTTSPSDGQQSHAGGRGAAIGDINARSGSEPGVAFYTHVSDRYDPFASRVIAATADEAPYVLDGLLYHQTGLTIEEHYTDTGGASDHVFGLMPFFGYRFAPRLRDIKERRLHLLPGQESGPLLSGMTGEPIALGHVAAHWDELLRFAASIRTGTVTASAMLRRLSAYPRQNGLALATRELGRLKRSIFMLDWLRDIGTPDEVARHIAPLGWEHISLAGDDSWTVEDRPDPDALRPLHAVSSLLAA